MRIRETYAVFRRLDRGSGHPRPGAAESFAWPSTSLVVGPGLYREGSVARKLQGLRMRLRMCVCVCVCCVVWDVDRRRQGLRDVRGGCEAIIVSRSASSRPFAFLSYYVLSHNFLITSSYIGCDV